MIRNSMSGKNQIRQGSYAKDQPFQSRSMNLLRIFFFCFVYMYMAVFRFNRFWIWSVVYIITSLRVQNRIVPGNLSVSVKPFSVYIVLCFLNYCIYDFRTVLRCVDKISTLIRSQFKQIDCCSFLAPYLNNHTVNHSANVILHVIKSTLKFHNFLAKFLW